MVAKGRILVIGAGSIGRRHAENLLARDASVAITDPVPERASSVPGAEPIEFSPDRLAGFDGVVVASPTFLHRQQTEAALEAGAFVLVEKPLDVNARHLETLVNSYNDKVMVGYNLRLHRPLEILVSWIDAGRIGRPLGASVWFGSYLPDWRKGTDYRDSYSAQRALGGGILLDATHELDLLIWIFGRGIRVAGAAMARVGDLEIDTEDSVKAVMRHAGGALIDLSLDYLSRRYRRGITVIGSIGTVRYDWASGLLELQTPDETVSETYATSVSISYEKEAEIFLKFIRGESAAPVDAATAALSVKLADEIREAASR